MRSAKPLFRQFSLRLGAEDDAFVRELRRSPRPFGGRTLRSTNEVIRTCVSAVRTYFGLPRFMADALYADMQARGLDLYGYFQDLLAHRYEELARARTTESRSADQTH